MIANVWSLHNNQEFNYSFSFFHFPFFCFFAEGGRLQKELQYVTDKLGVGAGATNELVIQTPVFEAGTVLTPEALLTHLDVIKAASNVVVESDDV